MAFLFFLFVFLAENRSTAWLGWHLSSKKKKEKMSDRKRKKKKKSQKKGKSRHRWCQTFSKIL
jgi:hypothetical protein